MKKDTSISWRRVDPAGLSLKGRKAVVVGGTGGLGRAITQLLAAQGAEVMVVGRTFRDVGKPGVDFVQADLSLMVEAQSTARRLPAETTDVLLFTTGIFAAPRRQENKEGLELDMAVSYLNRFVMLRELAPRLGTDRPAGAMRARVFNMAYPGAGQAGAPDDLNAERSYSAVAQHMNTVAGNEVLVLDAARRYPHLDVFGLNPGLVKTNIRRNFLGGSRYFVLLESLIGMLNPTPEQYAARIVPLLVAPEIEGHRGAMFDRKGQAILPSTQLTEPHVRKFIAASEAMAARAGVQVVAA